MVDLRKLFSGGPTLSEGAARKAKSIKVLRKEAVPVNDGLPEIETVAQASPPSSDEVLKRLAALLLVSQAAVSQDRDEARRIQSLLGPRLRLTAREAAFLEEAEPDEKARIQFSWAVEAAVPLAWAIGVFDHLWRPDNHTDPTDLVRFVFDDGGEAAAAFDNLRPTADILDQADLIYRYHWAVRDAELNGRVPPTGLHPGVVMERHRALNWLIGYERDWDEVTTDT